MVDTVKPASRHPHFAHSDRDYERVFVGNYQRDITHFYGIGLQEGDPGIRLFAFGYFTPDGAFHQGVIRWDMRVSAFVV